MTFNEACMELRNSCSPMYEDMVAYLPLLYNWRYASVDFVMMKLAALTSRYTPVYLRDSVVSKGISGQYLQQLLKARVWTPASMGDGSWLAAPWRSADWKVLDLYGVAAEIRNLP